MASRSIGTNSGRINGWINESDQGKLYACEDCRKKTLPNWKRAYHTKGLNLGVIVIDYREKCICYILCMFDWSNYSSKSGSQCPLLITSMVWVEYVHHSPFDQLCWHHIPAKAINTSNQKNASQFSGANGDVYSNRFQNAYRRVPGRTKHGISALKAVEVFCVTWKEPLSK